VLRQTEVAPDECLQVEAWPCALHIVAPQDLRRRAVRHGVGESLAVREHALRLHLHEQPTIELRWCFHLDRRGEPDGRITGELQADADTESLAQPGEASALRSARDLHVLHPDSHVPAGLGMT
jgi:hypothetical protein